jgi:hypothetical protein
MDDNKCRVYGYELISNFEGSTRDFIAELLIRVYGNKWVETIPAGITESVKKK